MNTDKQSWSYPCSSVFICGYLFSVFVSAKCASMEGGSSLNCFLTSILLLATSMAGTAQMSDFKGYQDPALFTRMPDYFLPAEDSVIDKAFDAFEFQLKEGTQSVEGRHLHYSYTFDEAAGNMPGTLQIVRNYEAAARKIGGQVLWDDVRRATIKISRSGQETWAFLEGFTRADPMSFTSSNGGR